LITYEDTENMSTYDTMQTMCWQTSDIVVLLQAKCHQSTPTQTAHMHTHTHTCTHKHTNRHTYIHTRRQRDTQRR